MWSPFSQVDNMDTLNLSWACMYCTFPTIYAATYLCMLRDGGSNREPRSFIFSLVGSISFLANKLCGRAMWSRFFQSLEVTMLAVILGNHVRHHSTLFCDPVPPLHDHTITHTHTRANMCVSHNYAIIMILGSRTSEVLNSLYLWRSSDQQLWKSCSAACKRWFMPWACREHDMFNWVPRVSQPHQSKLHCGHWELLWTIL